MTDERKQVHHADCGEVGDTGEHGELGSNAADAVREAAQDAADLRSEGIDATATPKGIEVKVPGPIHNDLQAKPLVTHVSK